MSERLLHTAERLAERLTPADLEATLRAITTTAVEVLPQVAYASITVMHADGRLDTAAITDDLLREIDAEQHRLHEGPCVSAAEDGRQIVCNDLRADERYPRYGRFAAERGIRSQVGLTLFTSPRSNGALNLYSAGVGAFDDPESIQALFATQAGSAIRYAQEIGNLRQALESRTVIGQATGRIMERYGLAEEQAFALLQRLSSTRNMKLRDVAKELVEEGTGPPPG
jgi:GAF domain-containing protein